MSTRDEVITGGRELANLLQTLPVKIEKNIMRAALRAGAAVMREETKKRVPVDQGDLRKSVRVSTRARKGQVTASVKAGNKTAYYAGMVEFGTRQHYITVSDSDRGPGRAYRNRPRGLASIRTVNRRSLILGFNLVGPSVLHPGSRPRPFMRPAADAAFPQAVKAVERTVRQRLTEAGLNVPPALPPDSD